MLMVSIPMAGPTGLEPATFRVTGGRSNQLNYGPIIGAETILLSRGFVAGRTLPACHARLA